MYEYVLKIRPELKGTALGTRVHKVIENHHLTGEPIDVNEVDAAGNRPGVSAQAGLHLIPYAPQPLNHLEHRIEFSKSGIAFVGVIDHVTRGPGQWVCWDYKTTKNLRYAKKPEDLRTDPQALIYGEWGFRESGHDTIDLAWVFFQTDPEKPKAKRVRLTVLKNETTTQWDEILRDAERIHELHDGKTSARNLMACSDYGGCPHATYCLQEDTMAFTDMIAKKLAESQNTPSAPSVPALPAAPSIPAPPTVSTIPTITPQSPVYVDLNAMSRDQLKALAMERGLCDQKCKLGADKLKQLILSNQVADRVVSVRPSARAPSPVPALPPPAAVPVVPEPTPAAPKGFTLYVNCAPFYGTGEEIVLFQKWAAPVYDEAARGGKVAHYKLAGYGQGPGLLSAALAEFMKQFGHELDGKALVVTSAGAGDVVAELEKYAPRVVKGNL